MTTYTFQEVRRTKTVKLKCGCGKRFQRKVAATQTVNPFNKNAAGLPKTYREIWKELAVRLEDMMPRTECPGCDRPAVVVSATVNNF
jgi:hypothetical protein